MKYLFLLFVIVFVFAQKKKKQYGKNCQPYNYSWSNFVLTWPGDFCRQHGKCNNGNWYENWDGRTFSIHGWWPSSSDARFLNCIRRGTDKFCDDPYKFQISKLKSLKNQLDSYWPDLTNNEFLEYQWDKHGVCYLNLLKRKKLKKLTDTDIFVRYFKKAVTEYESLTSSFSLTSGIYENSEALFKALNVNPKHGYASCRYQNDQYYLREVYFCYSLPQNKPGEETLIQCPSPSDNCNGPINLLNYKQISDDKDSDTSTNADDVDDKNYWSYIF